MRLTPTLTGATLTAALATMAPAQTTPDDLFDLLLLPQTVEIMHEEGTAYGMEVGADFFGGPPGASWAATVEQIYDIDRMEQVARAAFAAALDDADLEPIAAFYGGPLGARIVALELEARRGFQDEAVEEAAVAAGQAAIRTGGPEVALIEEFVAVNGLIDRNVTAALNDNIAFFNGLGAASNGNFGFDEDEMLSMVIESEPDIRASTTDWIYGLLTLAYGSLTEEELAAYVDFSHSDAGRDLNQALFAAFNPLFEDISRALGFAAGSAVGTTDL